MIPLKTHLFLLFNQLFFPVLLTGQDIVSLVDFAEQQVETGNLDVALSSFNRALFFSDIYPSPEIPKSRLLERTGDCYYRNGNFTEAIRLYGLAAKAADNDSVQFDIVLKRVHSYLLKKDFIYGLEELLMTDVPPLARQADLKNFYMGVTWFGLENFDSSEYYFTRTAKNDSLKKIVAGQFNKLKKTKHPDPSVAQVLSIIIPGLGQFYSGDVKNGFNSLLINGGLLVLGGHIAINYSWIDALFAVMPWYQRYYLGGIQNASTIAHYRLEEKRSRIYKELLKTIQG